MLIQTLCEYYDMNRKKICGGIPKGFEERGISHMIFLTPDGKISSIQDIREKTVINGKNGKSKEVLNKRSMILPKRSQKPGIDLNIAEHRALYIFGLNYDKKESVFNPDDKTKKASKSHECFVNGSLEFCEGLDSPIVNAFRAFLTSWNPADEVDNPDIRKIEKEYLTASYCFALEGHPEILLHEDEEFQKKYSEQTENKETEGQANKPVAMCPVEGKVLPVARIHQPEASMTVMMTTTVMTLTGTSTGLSVPHDDIRPTPAGMNMTGMISMRNLPTLFTSSSLRILVCRQINMITIPYILAGIGSGTMYLSISPIKDMARIIRNCFKYFIFFVFLLYIYHAHMEQRFTTLVYMPVYNLHISGLFHKKGGSIHRYNYSVYSNHPLTL